MNARTCPRCGTPLGAGALEGMCPKCLVADGSSANTTVEAAVGHANRLARGRAGEAPAHPGHAPGDGGELEDTQAPSGRLDRMDVGLADPDQVAREARDAADAVRAGVSWSDRNNAPTIEGYDILREVKHGGQGIVYLAVQLSTKRKVAIKVLLAGRYASRSARRRFEREIELVASLKHPNIISVFDSGTTADGHEYYVMDYVRGVPITQYVRDKKPTLEEVLALFSTTCDAVNHAHQRGVIHRDLKPSNVLVDVDGNVRVLDFGLAKALTDPVESQASVTGNVIGTLPYMSPEQTRANPDEIDTRADVYALGVILYEALTGKPPYPVSGTVAEVIRHISETEPAPPAKGWTSDCGVRTRSGRRVGRRRRGGAARCPLDGEIDTIVLKALAKERDRRYDSAGQFARDIRRYLNGEQIVARRASAWYQVRVFARRNKALVGAVLAIVVVLAAAVGMVSWQWQRAESEKLRAEDQKLRAEGESAKAAVAVNALGKFMAYPGDYFADQNDLLVARRLYTRALDESWQQDLPGSPILEGLCEIGSRPGGALPLLGSGGRGGGSGGFRGHAGHPNNVAVLRNSGIALTAGVDGRLILWDLLTGRAIPTSVDDRVSAQPLTFVAASPDEKFAAVAGNDGRVVLYQLSPFKPTGIVLKHPQGQQGWMVTLTNDLRVLTGTSAGTITLWDGKTGEQKRLYPADVVRGKEVAGLAFWPTDPRYAISGSGDGKVRLWDLERDEPLGIFTGEHRPDYMVNCVTFSPDGTRAASASFDGNVTVWHVRREAGAPTLQQGPRFLAHEHRVWRVAFSRDGKRAASASGDGTVRVWDPETGVELFQFKGQSGGQSDGVNGVGFWDDERVVSTGDLSPDEDRGGLTSALKVWDMRGGDGSGGEASVGGAVTGIVVNDDGVATVSTNTGTVTLHAGEDGRLHQSPAASGPASPPVRPAAYGKGKKLPHWGDGGRSKPAPASTTPAGAATPSKDLAPLSGGKGRLVGRGDGKLELWGFANSGGAANSPGQVLLRTLEGHKAAIQAAAVSPGERFIVSADALGTVRVWDLMRPARSRELEQQMAMAYELLAGNPTSPDAMKTLRNWYAFQGRDVSTDDLLERARVARQFIDGPGEPE